MTIIKNIPFKGFTSIELLLSLALASIFLTIAIPTFSKMLSQNQQLAQLYTLFSHHQLARSEAIKSNQPILLCKSSDGRQCTPKASWSDGWLIFSDTDNDKKISAGEQIIQIQQALVENLSLQYKGFGSHNYIRYFPSGRSSTNGTFTLCSQFDESKAKSFIIARSGRARIDTKTSGGKSLTCT